MQLVPAYIPDADYIDRQIDAEPAAERDTAQNEPRTTTPSKSHRDHPEGVAAINPAPVHDDF